MKNFLEKRDCSGCGVGPAFLHEPGCDLERCSCCGQQYACEGEPAQFWAGYYPGILEAVEQNLFVREGKDPNGPPWINEKVDKNHPDALPDLNSVYVLGTWSREKQKFVFN